VATGKQERAIVSFHIEYSRSDRAVLTLPGYQAWGFFNRRANLLRQDFSSNSRGQFSRERCLVQYQRFRYALPYPILSLRMILAAFSSLPKLHPHLQTCVLVDRVFFTITPQLEHSKAGVLGIHGHRNFLKYFSQVFEPDTELIPRCVVNRLS